LYRQNYLSEYEAFKKVLERTGLTLKEAIRDAILQWISENYPLDEYSFFQLKPGDFPPHKLNSKFKLKPKRYIIFFIQAGFNIVP